ncbi:Thioredoxin-like fold [Pseudocohnilembus persalinus]|uniref:glutathione transferase n=1 Tax=Pseudocohnilembus persalinus TaxID=266149 RepID=A0A0V0QSB4_PSEPJ|nr:Thioredoxin-like fold [Pseudocohnilembus persalinus]|eukprot:KRX05219.1 Thioredoxin-like fold [Pseudocohnilembus persalinus]
MSSKIQLSYWALRGRFEPIKMLVEYLEIPYELKNYEIENWQEWFMEDKPKLNSNFPNLPYLKNPLTNEVITESESICLYLCNYAKRMDFIGEEFQDRLNISQIKGVVDDLRQNIGLIAYDPNFNEKFKKEQLEKTVYPKLILVNDELKKYQFLNKGKLCYVDFYFYEFLNVLIRMEPSAIDKYQILKDYMLKIENIESIKKYQESDRYMKNGKLFGPTATWQG